MGQRAKDRSMDYYKRVVSQAASEAAQNNIEDYNFRRLVGAGIVRPDEKPNFSQVKEGLNAQ